MQEHGTPANNSSDSKSDKAPKKRVYQSQLPWSTVRWATQALAANDPKNCHKLRQQQALELLAAGFAIFPLPFGKKVNLTGTWHKHMVVEEDTLRTYWPEVGRGPKSLPWNIGISCKHSWPWKVVFDLDVKGAAGSEAGVEHALRCFMDAAKDTFAMYGTRVHRTPRGGYHVIYNSPAIGQHPDGRQILQAYSNSSAAIKARNIDVRGSAGDHGGYIVAPGSYFDGMDEHGVQGAGEGFYEVWHDHPVEVVPDDLRKHLVHYVTGASGLSGGQATDKQGNLLNGHSDGYTRARQWMAFHAPICKPGTGGGADATLMLVARELVNDYGLTPYLALELMTSEIILTDAAGEKRTVKAWNDRCVYGAGGFGGLEDTSFPWPIETLERKLDNALNDAARGRLQNARGSKLEALEFKFLQGLDDVVTAHEAAKKAAAELAEQVKHATHHVKGEEPKVKATGQAAGQPGEGQPWQPNDKGEFNLFGLDFVLGDYEDMEDIDWLWEGKIVAQGLNMIAGKPDQGKTTACYSICATITNGGDWPAGGGTAKRGRVIIISAEDNLKSIIKPKLKAMGADRRYWMTMPSTKKVDSEGNTIKGVFDLSQDLERLRHALKALKDVRLVFIDPLEAYYGKLAEKSHNSAVLRGMLMQMASVAEECGVAILAMSHINKNTDSTDILHRLSGAGAPIQQARVAHWVETDPQDEDRKLFLPMKHNLISKEEKHGLSFCIETAYVPHPKKPGRKIKTTNLNWGNEIVPMTAQQFYAGQQIDGRSLKGSPATNEAINFVQIYLGDGKEHAASDIKHAAFGAGVSEYALKEAARRLGVRKIPNENNKSQWFWQLDPAIKTPG